MTIRSKRRSELPPGYALLRSDRDDQERAGIFDEWIAAQDPGVRADVEYLFCQLVTNGPMSETGTKALLSVLIIYLAAPADVRDLFDQHGEYVRAMMEWAALEPQP